MNPATKSSIISTLPPDVMQEKALGLKASKFQSSNGIRFVEAFAKRNMTQKKYHDKEITSLKYHVQLLDKSKKKKKHGFDKTPKKKKRLSVREKKELKLFEIKPEEQKYELYLSMHDVWKEYMNDLINFNKLQPDNKVVLETVLKADYHGCILTVAQAPCSSMIGQRGIVVQETRNTFKLITEKDQLKTIPKAHCTFTFQLSGYLFTLFGDQIQVNSAERAVKKFKFKYN